MTDTEKAKVSKAENNAEPDNNGPKLLIEHRAFEWKDSKGRKHHTKAHVEVNPQLSTSRKKEALKLKAQMEAAEPKPARKPRAKKGPKPAEGASPAFSAMAKKNAKEAAREEAAPAAEAKADA